MSDVIYKFQLHGRKLNITKNQDRHVFEKHWHSYYEIIFYHNYRGSSTLNGETYPITRDCLFLLTPKDFHDLRMEREEGAVSYVIAFSERMIDAAVFGEITKGPIYIPQLPDWIAKQIEHLYAFFKGDSAHRETYLYHLFNSILIEILEYGHSLSHSTADINPMIQESISQMLSEPEKPYSLGDFARKFNVSATYFSRLFHENAGISFKQYLTMLRIEHSKRLLEEKNLPIIDVGSECGFNTPSQFIRAFKQITGMTPSAYRATTKQDK